MLGLLLFIVAIILLVIIEIVNFIYYLIVNKNIKGYWLSAAIDIDRFANRHFRFLFNNLLIKKNGYIFGNINETISEVLGHNIIKNTLTTTGKIVVFILTEKHCLNSIK